jgi:hypothetical protein
MNKCNVCALPTGSELCVGCPENPDEWDYMKVPMEDGLSRLVPVDKKFKEIVDTIVKKFNGALVRLEDDNYYEGEEMGISKEALEDIVKKEIALKIVNKDPFTAYDITKEVRSFIRSHIGHSEVRQIVYDLYEKSRANEDEILADYERYDSFSAFNGDGVRIYHPESVDPMEYLREIDPTSSVSPVSAKRDAEDLKVAALAVIQANDELQRAIATLQDIVDPEEDDGDDW